VSIGIYSWVYDTAIIPYDYKKTFYIIDEDGRLMLATNYDYIFEYVRNGLLKTREYTLLRHSINPENDEELMGLILLSRVRCSWPTIPAVDIYRKGAEKVAYVDWGTYFVIEKELCQQMRYMGGPVVGPSGRECMTFMGVPLEII
jgi:hypothetical protein